MEGCKKTSRLGVGVANASQVAGDHSLFAHMASRQADNKRDAKQLGWCKERFSELL